MNKDSTAQQFRQLLDKAAKLRAGLELLPKDEAAQRRKDHNAVIAETLDFATANKLAANPIHPLIF